MEYAADDATAIKARMAEIAKESIPLTDRIHELDTAGLDALGRNLNTPRTSDESDYTYRLRLKQQAGIT